MILNIPPTLSQIRAGNLRVPLQFNADLTSQYDSAKTQILANGTGGINLLIGVPSTGYTLIKSGIINLFSAGSAQGVQNQNSWGVGVYGTSVGGAGYAGLSSTGLSDILGNVPTGSSYKLGVQGVEKYRLSSTLQESPSLSLGGVIGSSTDPGTGGLSLTNRVQFSGAGTADATKTLIYADASAGNLFANVPAGKYHQWLVNGAPLFSLGAVGGTTTAGAWGLGAFGSTTTDITKPGFYCDANNLIYNVGSAYTHFFRVNNSSSASIDTNGFNVLKNITFAGAGSASSALSMMWADAANGNLFSNVPTGKYEQHRVNGVGLLSLGRASSTQDNSYFSIGGYGSNGTVIGTIGGILGGPFSNLHNVPSGNTHRFMFNDVEKYRLSSTLLEAPSLSLGGTIGSSVDGGAGSLALTNRIQFTGAGTVDTTKTLIHADTADGNMRIQAPLAKSIAAWISTFQAFAVDDGGIYPGKGIIFNNSAGIANSAQTQIYPDGANGNLLINVPTGKSVALYVSGSQVLAIDANGIKLPVSASPASNGTGVAGQISWDSSYIYVCTATNTWKRAALTGGY